MGYSDKFTSELQKKFVVVQWDQRETGETLKLNPSPIPLTLTLFENDTHELIDTLLHRFHQPKLYLAGHSWGTVLGFYIAGKYPHLLYAYLPISPVINQRESELKSLAMMKEKAKQTNNKIASAELATVHVPFENWEQLYYHRKWLFYFNGQTVKSFTKSYALSWASTWLGVWNEASATNLFESHTEIDCPVYFFVGRKDFQTNASITEQYYKKLKAPKKELFWFERSGHSIPSKEPELLQRLILEKVLE